MWYCEEDGTDCWRSLPPPVPPGTGPVGAGSVLLARVEEGARAGGSARADSSDKDKDKDKKKCDRKKGNGDVKQWCAWPVDTHAAPLPHTFAAVMLTVS